MGKGLFMEISRASRYSSGVPLSQSERPPGSHVTSGNDVTQLLKRWRKGSREAEAALMERVYGELRRLAAGYMRRERVGKTLQPTAVVNEAFMRLLPQRGVSWENRAHFFGIAAKMMRRVLVDHARRKRAIKRDAGPGDPVSISGVPSPAREADQVDVLALNEALSALAALDPRQSEIVEMRFFAGLTVEEIAEVLEISPATVKREWSTAKMWLRREMRGLST
jgi:RNA polymerase sigma-70 factor (ECF subfamily)